MNDTPTAGMIDYAYDQSVFSDCFRLGIVKSERNYIFDQDKFWFFMFGGPRPPTNF